MEKSIDIKYTCGPGGYCPVQADGFINGLPFYFRSRHEHWYLKIAKTPDGDPLGDEDVYFHEEEYPGYGPHDAGYANQQECIDFIEKAARIILNEQHCI